MQNVIRLRRNRKTSWIRDLLAENVLNTSDLVLPIFIIEGFNIREEISSMPGVYRYSIDQLMLLLEEIISLNILAIALFPVIEKSLKDDIASEAFNPNNLVCRAIKAIKKRKLNLGVICDIALDPYTIHGHDGIIINNEVDNDVTVDKLCKQALILAQVGADILAPSDMMDGRVFAIRKHLDQHGFYNINILSYAAKFASCFYGPFRTALKNTNISLNKSTYQMDMRNSREALQEIEQDIKEGADFIMIKPALPFLDIINLAKKNFKNNIFAYQVSGEYSMLKYASMQGVLNWESSLLETLISIKRAGASAIFTYGAIEVASLLDH